jgi:hypothetical protein
MVHSTVKINFIVPVPSADRGAVFLTEGRHLRTSLDVTMATQRSLMSPDKKAKKKLSFSTSPYFPFVFFFYYTVTLPCLVTAVMEIITQRICFAS